MSKTELTVKDVESHNNKNSTWIVIDDNVYDVTAFLNEVLHYLLSHLILSCVSDQI